MRGVFGRGTAAVGPCLRCEEGRKVLCIAPVGLFRLLLYSVFVCVVFFLFLSVGERKKA